MRRRLLGTLIAMATMFTFASPASAHPFTEPSWNTWERGYLTRQVSSYKHYIPICLESAVGGPTWNIAGDARHARIENARSTWTLGGELLYFASNTSCATWRAGGGPFLSINRGPMDGADHAVTVGAGTLCNEAWGFSCSKEVVITYDTSSIIWYTGTGATPAGQFDFWSYILHEMGHSMRCGPHSSNSADVMYGSLSSGAYKRVLTATDKLCYTHYYGTTH